MSRDNFLFLFSLFFSIGGKPHATGMEILNIEAINITISDHKHNGTTDSPDASKISENRYILFGLLVFAILWIKLFNLLYYWLMVKVFKIMVWPDDDELRRRLGVYTSMSMYGTNIPGMLRRSYEKKLGNQEIKRLLKSSEMGELESDFFTYSNESYVTPQILTKIPLPNGQSAFLVENVQIVDNPGGSNVLGNNISTAKVGTMKNNASSHHAYPTTNSHDNSNYAKKTKSVTPDDMSTYKNLGKKRKSGKSVVKEYSSNHSSWLRRKCYCCFGRKIKSGSDDKYDENNKFKNDRDYDDQTYSRDQFSKAFDNPWRFYRGNFLILLCDVTVVVGLVVIAIVVYYTLDLEWNDMVSPQTLVAVFGLFKLSEGFSGLIGYANIIWHDSLYRGDIVEIIGTWNSIGGKVVGIVQKVTVADVCLLTNQPFQSHFAAKNTPSPVGPVPSLPQLPQSTLITPPSPPLSSLPVQQTFGQYNAQPTGTASTETVSRYMTLNTAFRVPAIRASALDSDEMARMNREISSKKKVKKQRQKDYSEGDTIIDMDDDVYVELNNGDKEDGYVTYIKINQEISGDVHNVPMIIERISESFERARINTNDVYRATIFTKIGWTTNLKITFK